MDLNKHISEIQKGIREGLFSNEASVSQGIVLRLLQALNWPTYDTQVVWPEYMVEGRLVDYALCHPNKNSVIFIEVKMLGKSSNAEKLLFEYAFHLGVPMAVLTDGSEWHFFLPGEQGLYQERRVYKLDLLERNTEEISQRLTRYLSYEAVCTKEALHAAREDYKNVSKQRELKKTLPLAWSKLIEEPDDLLVALLIDKVESLCGYKPDESMVVTFLADKKLAAKPFQESFETIQKRVKETRKAHIIQKHQRGAFDKSAVISAFPCVDRKVLPGGLADILEVCLEMYLNGRGYNNAVRTLFERRQLSSIHTIYDKCTRHIGLDTDGFKELVNDKEQLATYLKARFPDYGQQIDDCL